MYPGSGTSCSNIKNRGIRQYQSSREDAPGRSSTLTPLPPLVVKSGYTGSDPPKVQYGGVPGNTGIVWCGRISALRVCERNFFSGLAQLVEHIIRNDGVRRSSRRAGANIEIELLPRV